MWEQERRWRPFSRTSVDVASVALVSTLLLGVGAVLSPHPWAASTAIALCNLAFNVVKIAFVYHAQHDPTSITQGQVLASTALAAGLTAVSFYFWQWGHEEPWLKAVPTTEAVGADGYLQVRDEEDGLLEGSKEGKRATQGKATLKRMLLLARGESSLIVVGTVALLAGSIAQLAIPFLFSRVVDAVSRNGDDAHEARRHLDRAVLSLVTVVVITAVMVFVRGTFFTMAGQRVVAKLRTVLYEAIMSQEMGFFDGTRTGDLQSRLSVDSSLLQNVATVNMSMLLRSMVAVLGGVIILFLISWRLTLVMISVVPLISVLTVLFGKRLKRARRQFQDALGVASAQAEETISQIRTVRAFSREPHEIGRYGDAIWDSYMIGKKLSIIYGCFVGAVMLLSGLALSGVLFYGGYLAIDGHLSVGLLTAFLLYSLTLAVNLGTITSVFGSILQALGAADRIFAILDRRPEMQPGTTPVETIHGHLQFADVWFSYPSRPDVPSLRGFSLDVAPGTTCALVGESGAGKSTVVSLLERFYDPSEGSILIDGIPLPSLDLVTFRRTTAIVSQNPQLFATSIKENIAYGVDNCSDEDIVQAARRANAHEFVSAFPDGYETVVGEQGVLLSGGQRQRIAIARAILMAPSLLILDEATSALDADSEHEVVQALEELMHTGQHTTIVIAHRLSTIRNADNIVVLEKGAVSEQGTHADLMSHNGVYAALMRRQLDFE